MGRPHSDVSGKKFGLLTAVSIDHVGAYGQTFMRCMCDCGNETVARRTHLMAGSSTSCGCHRAKLMSDRKTTHGHHKGGKGTSEYNVWSSMKARCNIPTAQAYENYGGRGIKICDRWLGPDGFANFFADMGPKPAKGTLDRLDNNKGYSPENCAWRTMKEQCRNRRSNKIITYGGISASIVE